MKKTPDSAYDWSRIPVRFLELRGQAVTLRPLAKGDEAALGAYFLGLSPQTQRVYRPHAFDRATAASCCAALGTPEGNVTLRLIAVAGESIVGYFIVHLGLHESDRKRRYADLDAGRVSTLAPSVADVWQNGGLGTVMMAYAKDCARLYGKTVMVLWGGVREENARGVHFYAKAGFRKVGEFPVTVTEQGRSETINNYDMIVEL